MPIYEYRCNACRHEFEELARSMEPAAKPRCPECGGKVSRKQSVFAAHDATPACCKLPGGCQSSACADGGCPMAM
jgi:putative FmdB family regulatory protein